MRLGSMEVYDMRTCYFVRTVLVIHVIVVGIKPNCFRAVGAHTTPTRFQDLSTVAHCASIGLEQPSSVCRYAVSMGLVVYYPYGQSGTEQYLPSSDFPP